MGVWGFQVQPIPSSIFTTGPCIPSTSQMLCSFCVITEAARNPAVPSPPPLHISGVSGCQQTGIHSSHHVLRRSPSHPSQMVKARYREEEQFSKGQTEVGEEPWGMHTPPTSPPASTSAHLLIF